MGRGRLGTLQKILLLTLAVVGPSCGGGGGGGSSGPPQKWLIMVYMAGDNNLDAFVPATINAMESVPASTYVTIAVQEDTKTIPVNGSTTCKRLVITPDADLVNISSPTVTDLGEINSSSGTEIEAFVAWATTTYVADRYVLILWDHGGQWYGWDQDDTDSPGTVIGFQQLKTMFGNILTPFQTTTGHAKLDMIGFDACLMAGLEIDQMLSAFADYRVASCEVEFSKVGLSGPWDYAGWLKALVKTPGMSVNVLGRSICNSFMARINSFGIGNQTISVADLSNVPALVTAVDTFAQLLITRLPAELIPTIARERREAKEYDVLDPGNPGAFVDLRDFAGRIAASSSDANLRGAAGAVVGAVDNVITYRIGGSLEFGHGGVSIYFPNYFTSPGYANVDLATTTQWDTFIAQYQTQLGGDTTPPGVFIVGPPSGTTVSPSAPIGVQFSMTGIDIYDLSVRISTQVSPSQWQIYGELDYGSLPAGPYTFTWDAAVYLIWDGVSPNSDYLSCLVAQPGGSVYTSTMYWVEGGVDVVVVINLNLFSGSGTVIGTYIVAPVGAVIAAPINPGDTLVMEYPILDITSGAISYTLSSVSLVVPPGGMSAFSPFIQRLPLYPGPHDLDIFVEDYAGNFGTDYRTYVAVP